MLRPLVMASRAEFEEELKRINVDLDCLDIFLEKRDSFLLKVSDISTPAANILKQTALSSGADVAVHREVITGKIERSDAIYMGTRRQLRRIAVALSGQPFGLAGLEKAILGLIERLDGLPEPVELPGGRLTLERPVIMGILNVTPDSFADGGRFLEPSAALKRMDAILEEGADIVDVGAESTRPGSDPVPASEQLKRLSPVFEYLKGKRIIWSLDTIDREVARQGLDAGASIINDVSGGSDALLWNLVRDYSAAYVLMHTLGKPKTMQVDPRYDDFNAELFGFFHNKLGEIEVSGLARSRIIIDPGIGFGKRVQDNTAAIRRIGELRAFGLPVMVGTSRKSYIGKLLNLEVDDRLAASLAAAVLAYWQGAHLLRVHDVKETRHALDIAAVARYQAEAGS